MADADVNLTNELGVMPLAFACETGDGAMVQKLLAAGANPNVALRPGDTPLMLATRSGGPEAVKALLAHGAAVNTKSTAKGQTALMWAAAESHSDVVQLLIEFGADVQARSDGKYMALLFSARANDVDSTKALLAAGANVNDADHDGNSALVAASLMGNTEVAKFLLDNGADVNAAGRGFTALHWAVGFCDIGVTGPFGIKAEHSEWSALAGLRGDAKFDFAKLLLDRGAKVNAKLTKGPRRGGLGSGGTINLSMQGATPYLLAANAAVTRLMHLLLDHGADPHVILKNGTTALMLVVGVARASGASWVTENQALEATKLVMENGSDVNSANVPGDTAMHAAAYGGFNKFIQLLVDKGADLSPKNERGKTPYLIANGQGPRVAGDNPYQPATAAFLKKLGADTTGSCDWPCLKAADGDDEEDGGGGGPAPAFDQIAAEELGKKTQVTSLEIGLDSSEVPGACDTGCSCAYSGTVAWRDTTTPLPMENDPRRVFERLFGASDSTDHPHERLRRLQTDRSLLDSVMPSANQLAAGLGAGDRVKLSQYLDSVRDIERRIQISEAQSSRELPVVRQPTGGIPATFTEHVEVMSQLLLMALQTDMTRIFTFMFGREQTGRVYPEIGVPDGHHGLSHHGGDPKKMAKVSKSNQHQIEMLAKFGEKLRSTPDGDGSLLDHSMILYGGGISDGDLHNHNNLPILLMGGKSAQFKGGRHSQYAPDTPLMSLRATLLDKMGVPFEHLGDANGRLAELSSVA